MERCAKSGEDRSPPSAHGVNSWSVSPDAAVGGTLTAAAVPAYRLSAGAAPGKGLLGGKAAAAASGAAWPHPPPICYLRSGAR